MLWSDLPRRLATISIGAPIIIYLLTNSLYSKFLIQASHLLCAIEWTRLVPKTSSSSESTKQQHEEQQQTDDANTSSKRRGQRQVGTNSYQTQNESSSSSNNNESLYNITTLFPVASLLLSTSKIPLFLLPLFATLLHFSSQSHPSISNHYYHGLLFLSLGYYHLLRISSISFSHSILVLLTVWNCDTGALLAGRLGRMLSGSGNNDDDGDPLRGMVPKGVVRFLKGVSSSKSVTGIFGGIILATLTTLTIPSLLTHLQNSLPHHFTSHLDLSQISTNDLLSYPHILLPITNNIVLKRAVVGFVLGVSAIGGDLVESQVKRNAGVKDSGKVLPGHGGILDRMDSLLISASVYYCWCL